MTYLWEVFKYISESSDFRRWCKEADTLNLFQVAEVSVVYIFTTVLSVALIKLQ